MDAHALAFSCGREEFGFNPWSSISKVSFQSSGPGFNNVHFTHENKKKM